MNLTIDRKRWLRGGCNSGLLVGRKMCCLGFLALACRVKKEEIRNHARPSDALFINWPKGIINKNTNGNTKLCQSLMSINDDAYLKDKQREEKLTKLFKKIDVNVEFIN